MVKSKACVSDHKLREPPLVTYAGAGGGAGSAQLLPFSLRHMHGVHCLHIFKVQCSAPEVFAFLFSSIPLNNQPKSPRKVTPGLECDACYI